MIGPVRVGTLASEAHAFVGWMALVISGPGYFFPWDFRYARERAEACEEIRRLVAVCQSAWPVPIASCSPEAETARRAMSDIWLYDDFTHPLGWLWYPDETG